MASVFSIACIKDEDSKAEDFTKLAYNLVPM